jgi:hypothetical protein
MESCRMNTVWKPGSEEIEAEKGVALTAVPDWASP